MVVELLIQIGKYLLIFFVTWTVLSFAWRNRRTFSNVHSRWHHTFDQMLISPKEFYDSVADELKKKGIKDIDMVIETYSEGGMFSGNRAYLKIKRRDQLFLVCAAPFGTECFISWWFGDPVNLFDEFIQQIPFAGKYLSAAMNSTTFFEMDTDNMFKDIVKNCVLKVIDSIANDKGIRPLSELERQPNDSGLISRKI